LCIALGCTLATVEAMSAAEFAFWSVYYSRRGFPADRIEAATAIAGAAQCRTWGARVEPKELIPKFGERKTSNAVLAARLSALPGAKVKRVPRPDRKPGAVKDAAKDEGDKPRPRLLNPKPKRKR
jgi:hypothetical protein